MISKEFEFIYIAIRKTGSASMNLWLKKNFNATPIGFYHDFVVPEKYKDYCIFTLIRNPYDRALSGYYAERTGNSKGKTFEKYIYDMILWRDYGCPNGDNLFRYRTQLNIVEISFAKYIIKLEELDMSVLPFMKNRTWDTIPHIRKSPGKPQGNAIDILERR